MKRVLLMALKDLKLLTRDKIGMFFMVAFPIIMGVFFGFVMGSMGDSESTTLTVAVIDEDDSETSRQFVESLQEIESLDVRTMGRAEAADQVRRGRLIGLIAVPKGFGETAGILWADPPAIEVGIDPSRSAEGAMLEGMLMQSMGQLVSQRFQDPEAMRGFIEEARESIQNDESISPALRPLLVAMMGSFDSMFDAIDQVQQQPGAAGADENPLAGGMQMADIRRIDVTREPEPGSQAALLSNIRSKWDISFPQSMVWGVLGCVAGFATLMVRERTLGTLTRLHVAPIARWEILAGKGLGCFISVVCVITMMMLVGTALGMRPRSWPMLGMAAVSTAFCFVGIMMLLSLLGKTEQAVGGAAWGACTVMAMFGGGMIPAAFMPGFMKAMSNYDPVKWAVVSVEGAVWRGFSMGEMLLHCSVLWGFGVVSLVLGGWLVGRQSA